MKEEEIDLKEIEKANPIIHLAVELGIEVKGSLGKCFRTERHASPDEEMTLFFKPGKNTFFCRTCQDVGGSAVDLVCQVRGWDRPKAVEWLSRRGEANKQIRDLIYGRNF